MESYDCRTTPIGVGHWVRDYFDTPYLRNFFPEKNRELRIEVSMTVGIMKRNPFDFLLDAHATNFPFDYTAEETAALRSQLQPSGDHAAGLLQEWLDGVRPDSGTETVAFVTELNQSIWKNFEYGRRDQPGVQSPEETLKTRSGSCRDFAWLLAEACRSLGLAARFVSGYLYVPGGTESEGDTPESTMHAWSEIYLPGAGWKGFDPANGVLCDEYYLPTATARTPEGGAPVQGTYFSDRPVTSAMHSELQMEVIG